MKKNIGVLMFILSGLAAYSEEFSNISEEQINERFGNNRTIQGLVRGASCAGVGLFINEPSSVAPFVDIRVQQWLTPARETNIVRIHELDEYSTNWVFPTNVPIAFFAVTKLQVYGEHPVLFTDSPDFCFTNEEERIKLVFLEVDRSWFRTTRDNGIVYSFATNLWECLRSNPNSTNYYEVLRDTERSVSMQDSWRVHSDAYKGLSWLFHDASESYLAEKLNDPLLSPIMRNSVGNRLWDRFGWTYTVTNNTVQWHPPQ